ncbi:tRNA (adenosine(37)-N6)-threonylcarbamoyltransferase complex transferase subunit TsaD [Patescibacteria group bacterium]|nr:tRNA (adenosine(37)-N6)-threonylcarbamoyltransferase complex transferase subunit TsaD [Patescibacteria group bacterium]MBU4481773.1 tRNA (adenosine(37)-N6)-threonylcarbamoyltransferase complex transferase subunit TsaD [Patescibacteria group bacterium]
MIILGIETSCDDTCISLIKSKIQNPKSKTKGINFEILSNVVSSQVKIHQKYGGVYPFLAKREHQRNLPIVFDKALLKAGFVNPKSQIPNPKQIPLSRKRKFSRNLNSKFQIPNIDLIAVTVGPGLEPCLWTGINFAKELAKKLKIPLVPVNHLEAHILANFIGEKSKIQNPKSKIQNPKSKIIFPAICLVVSGGNTQLILMRGIGQYKILGETRDDAAGECFDKCARILGLGYPGGPAIAKLAKPDRGRASVEFGKSDRGRASVKLPRPMIYQKNYDFSFSGLKTAFLYKVKSEKHAPYRTKGSGAGLKVKSYEFKRAMAAEVQQAIIDVLIYKTIKAAKDYKAKSIILGGGVAANDELRRQFQSNVKCQMSNVKFLVPAKKLCADNAAMIAATAFFHREKATKDWPSSRNLTSRLRRDNTPKAVKFSLLGWKKIKANANLKI